MNICILLNFILLEFITEKEKQPNQISQQGLNANDTHYSSTYMPIKFIFRFRKIVLYLFCIFIDKRGNIR